MVKLCENSEPAFEQVRRARFVRRRPSETQRVAPNVALLLIRARYFDPTTGEFTSRDPLEYVDGASLYRGYMGIGGTDPWGLDVIDSYRVGRYYYTVEEHPDGSYSVTITDRGSYLNPLNYCMPQNVHVTTIYITLDDMGIKDFMPGIDDLAVKIKLRNVQFLEGVSSAANATLEIGEAGFYAGVFIVTVAVPGPEDVIIAAFAARGLRLAKCGCKWKVLTESGEELSEEAAERAAREVAGEFMARGNRTLQTGGNTLNKGTGKSLNQFFGEDLSKREWGRALEGMKRELGLRNDQHGKILGNGNYVDDVGNVLGNLGDYIK